jgi:hypothetical protein
MSYRVKQFQETPNPNALKCILDRKVTDRPRSYFKAEDAMADELATRLFAIPGVTNILISGDWITVNKTPEAAWAPIRAGVERALAAGPE